jgi:hypothetical protein
MTRNLMTCIFALSLAGAAVAEVQSPASIDSQHITPSQLKTLAKQAHTPEQYNTVAGYYGQMQDDYLRKAAEEKKEWERRSQMTASLAQKYPRPADSARNLYEYFMYKASEMGTLKTRFAQLADSGSTRTVK